MITALKLKRAIMKEAEKKHLNVECFLKNSTLRGINEGAYGHVINISSGGCLYVDATIRVLSSLNGKVLYRWAKNKKDWSSSSVKNGFNQWVSEEKAAETIINTLNEGIQQI